jgi:hypothetical protein
MNALETEARGLHHLLSDLAAEAIAKAVESYGAHQPWRESLNAAYQCAGGRPAFGVIVTLGGSMTSSVRLAALAAGKAEGAGGSRSAPVTHHRPPTTAAAAP